MIKPFIHIILSDMLYKSHTKGDHYDIPFKISISRPRISRSSPKKFDKNITYPSPPFLVKGIFQ